MTLPPEGASLRELQQYVANLEQERGFVDEAPIEKCLLLGEEVGELFRAVRTQTGMGMDPLRSSNDIAEELADVLIFVLAIANRFGVDLDRAFRVKQEANESRTWVRRS